MPRPDQQDLENMELRLLLEAIYEHYGYDFRDYAEASLKRRVKKCMQESNVRTISGFQEKVLHDHACMERFLNTISIDVTSMFRDPGFYLTFRQKVIPLLKTYPSLRLWCAGCASGEEVYSTAILLKEDELYDKTRIYATDLNEALLKEAKEGIYPLKAMQEYTKNYLEAGGRRSFSEYYTAKYEHTILNSTLKKNIFWAQHNLSTDASFNEFNVIFCRNVMIYFNHSLQARVHHLIYESLPVSGILCLGLKESLKFTPHEGDYEPLDERVKIYRKTK